MSFFGNMKSKFEQTHARASELQSVINRLKYASDDELRRIARSGSSDERKAAEAILRQRGKL